LYQLKGYKECVTLCWKVKRHQHSQQTYR